MGVQAGQAGRRVLLLGWQLGLPVVDWADRDRVVDWSVDIHVPALATREMLTWAIHTAGVGAEIAVWTTGPMGEDWWAYLESLALPISARFIRGRELAMRP